MRTVHKSQARSGDRIAIPHSADLLSVQMQGRYVTAWYLTGASELPVRHLEQRMTGETCEFGAGAFVATVQDVDGLVWHIFDPAAPQVVARG